MSCNDKKNGNGFYGYVIKHHSDMIDGFVKKITSANKWMYLEDIEKDLQWNLKEIYKEFAGDKIDKKLLEVVTQNIWRVIRKQADEELAAEAKRIEEHRKVLESIGK